MATKFLLTKSFCSGFTHLPKHQSIHTTKLPHHILPLQSHLNHSSKTSRNFPLQSFTISQLSRPIIAFPSVVTSQRSYSSFFGNKGGGEEAQHVPASAATESNLPTSSNDWSDGLKKVWQAIVDATTYTTQKAQEASDEITPYVQHLLDTYPYLKNVVVPVGWTMSGTIFAWWVMPRVLKKLHKASMQGPARLLPVSLFGEQVPYEKSVWGALEDPVRYLVTFVAFSQLGVMFAPTTIASQYITQACSGAVTIAFVWFLYRWKTNVFSRAVAAQNVAGLDRENLLALDTLSSVGLFVLGATASAEAFGVSAVSVLTLGGIGGAATAFAAKDILGDVLSGFSMKFSKPFSLGDTIKAGTIEGQVVEMGLTTTSLLSLEKYPVIVRNSLFSQKEIVNKSRAALHGFVTNIRLQIDDLEKIPQMSEAIKSMLELHSQVFLEKEKPYCMFSRIDSPFAELTVGCNLKKMSKDDLYCTKQDILLEASRIIKQHGGVCAERSTAYIDKIVQM